MKRQSTLTNWKIEDRGDWYILLGIVLNDDRFPDGEVVRTSMLERIDFVAGVAETKNTVYRLV
jgi:hypothetical protein